MTKEQYIIALKIMKKSYLDASEELFIKFIETADDKKEVEYYDTCMKYLGIVNGLQKAIDIFKCVK